MFTQTPIYDRLVTERGDIPTQVRAEAERIQRELGRIMAAPLSAGLPAQQSLPPAPRGFLPFGTL
ncbi:hypothetical protein [Streptomyces galbus]|uniref:Uncharacterized protein n=1 Tax=Streptomyces galbus TaxID=33898 RepID=A0A4U5W7C2_STRGB|nr:hypothetical protein [Streptomyces galbus]NKQ24577.1 hypothetical protein [Streptomyces galbus]TKS97463.1 hypothetical protein E4U92_32955 [Streptomyces galbus]GHD41817.1 hypothetical protein GCM10010335_44000 [Streptomyces galbus]